MKGLYFARVELGERREEQEKRGVYSAKKLTFEERLALSEQEEATAAKSKDPQK